MAKSTQVERSRACTSDLQAFKTIRRMSGRDSVLPRASLFQLLIADTIRRGFTVCWKSSNTVPFWAWHPKCKIVGCSFLISIITAFQFEKYNCHRAPLAFSQSLYRFAPKTPFFTKILGQACSLCSGSSRILWGTGDFCSGSTQFAREFRNKLDTQPNGNGN